MYDPCDSCKYDIEGFFTLRRHQMEAVSALLDLCEGNPPVTGGFLSQKAGNVGFGVFFGVNLKKWRPCNDW